MTRQSNKFNFFKWAFSLLLVFTFATSALAEDDVQKDSELKALMSISAGNALLAEDGTLFMSLRIGLDFAPLLSTGLWVSTTIEDVRNYNAVEKQMVRYRSFGAFVELFPLHIEKFSLSVPIQIGGGAVYTLNHGDEAFESEEYFFTGEMAIHLNYRVTKILEISLGGGYRMFAGIYKANLDNMDFCTPFGELRFTIKE